MTKSIVAYNSRLDKATDEVNDFFLTQFVKFVLVGVAISVPMFGWGAMTAPAETNRWETGLETTLTGHAFLWEKAIDAGVAVGTPVMEWMNNGDTTEASEDK